METEAFIRWALDDRRTIEERYTTELLVELAVDRWHWKHKTGRATKWQEKRERDRQRKLNPAYQPSYSEMSLRRAAEMFPDQTETDLGHSVSSSRPVRDLAVLPFFPWIEKVTAGGQVADCAFFAELPCLRTLGFSGSACEDYRPLA